MYCPNSSFARRLWLMRCPHWARVYFAMCAMRLFPGRCPSSHYSRRLKMGVARYTIFHFVKMVTGSARLFVPCRGRSNWKNPFPIGRRRIPKTEKIFHFWNESNPTRRSQFLHNPDQKRKSPVARALSSHRNGFINSADVRHFNCIYPMDKMSCQFWRLTLSGGSLRRSVLR